MKKVKSFISGVKKEMSRVRWTTKKDLVKYSIATVIFVICLGGFFYLIDLGVATLRTLG